MSAKRYIAAFFRGRWLYTPLLLLLVAATILGSYYLVRTQYEATARIWVDRPALAGVLDPATQTSLLTTPAQQQADKLSQFIQTDSFIVAILEKTKEAGQLAGADRDRVIKDVRGKIAVTPIGPNTVRITYTGGDPVLCQQVVQNTIEQFRGRDLTARVEQSAIERQFYQKQLQIYEDQVTAAGKRVEDFQRVHPYPDPSSPQYLELQGLQRELESARALLTTTRTKVEQANAADSLSDISRQVEFQVLDAPTVPTRPAATVTRLVTYLAVGLAASFAFILAAIAFSAWQDTTIRNSDDLQRLTSAPLLDAIPHLTPGDVRGGGHHRPAGAAHAPQIPPAPGQFDEPAAVYPSRITEQ